ncbi:MAG: hypothetical protein QOI82_3563 [Actinomycetota bacterium]|nr:hypothetical protein [Actinomycetota bacterium]
MRFTTMRRSMPRNGSRQQRHLALMQNVTTQGAGAILDRRRADYANTEEQGRPNRLAGAHVVPLLLGTPCAIECTASGPQADSFV